LRYKLQLLLIPMYKLKNKLKYKLKNRHKHKLKNKLKHKLKKMLKHLTPVFILNIIWNLLLTQELVIMVKLISKILILIYNNNWLLVKEFIKVQTKKPEEFLMILLKSSIIKVL
jgi:hypothetical protein